MTMLPFACLIIGMISLYVCGNKKIHLSFIAGSIFLSIIMQTTTVLGGTLLIFFMILCWLYFDGLATGWIRVLTYWMLVGMGICFIIHCLPGFNVLPVYQDIQLSPLSKPFNIYLSFDKGVMALILGCFIRPSLHSNQQFSLWNKHVIFALSGAIAVISILGLISGYIAIDPKFSPLFFIWGINNLFFVCFAEEILFRGVIQKTFSSFFEKYHVGFILPLLLSSILFGLVHYKGGIAYIGLATIAGIFYGYAYQKTKRVEAATLVHFGLNASHFLLFTYPSAIPH